MKTTARARQSVPDIAVRYAGSVEAAWEIAEQNGLSLTDDIEPGREIEIPDDVTSALTARSTDQPATAITEEEINAILGRGEGVEHWAIEYDFVIS